MRRNATVAANARDNRTPHSAVERRYIIQSIFRTLTVTSPGGAPSYEAKPHVLVGRLDIPRPGDTLDLSCDPAEHEGDR